MAISQRFAARRSTLLLGALLLGACAERRATVRQARPSASPPTSAEASSPPTHTPRLDQPLGIALDGRIVPLAFGRADIQGDELRIQLGSSPCPCGETCAGLVLGFSIRASPGGAFFTGKAFFVGTALTTHSNPIPHRRDVPARVRLEPFRVAGDPHVKGTLELAAATGHAAAGQFAAAICDERVDAARHYPTRAREGPARGFWGSVSFSTRSALAHTKRDEDGSSFIEEIVLFPHEGVSCDRAPASSHRVIVKTHLPSKEPVPLGPQPAYGGLSIDGGWPGEGRGWVVIERPAYERGASIEGEIYLEQGEKRYWKDWDRITGRFTAIVCSWGPP